MKKTISILVVIMMVFSVVSPLISNSHQTGPLSDADLQNTVGGQDILDCLALYGTCLASAAELGWIGLLICSALAAYCIS